MSSSTSSSSGGIGFVGLLTIVFITLKLTGYLSWSWFWVLSPVWISTCVLLAVAAIAMTLFFFLDRTPRPRRRF